MYGCFDPEFSSQYTYKCVHCGSLVTPGSYYRTTYGSPGYIFFCPVCNAPEFAYEIDKHEHIQKKVVVV